MQIAAVSEAIHHVVWTLSCHRIFNKWFVGRLITKFSSRPIIHPHFICADVKIKYFLLGYIELWAALSATQKVCVQRPHMVRCNTAYNNNNNKGRSVFNDLIFLQLGLTDAHRLFFLFVTLCVSQVYPWRCVMSHCTPVCRALTGLWPACLSEDSSSPSAGGRTSLLLQAVTQTHKHLYSDSRLL